MIRLLLAEDQTIIRQGLRRLLDSHLDLQVVGEAENGQQAVAQVEILQPDLVLMDVRMPMMDGVTATQIICDRFPKVKVLVLTTFDQDLRICHKQWRGYTAPRAKQLGDKHGNSRTF